MSTTGAVDTTRVVSHQEIDDIVADLFADHHHGLPHHVSVMGTPLAMVEMGAGLMVYVDPAGEGHGLITDIRDGIPVGFELVNVLTTLALWRPAS